jgi:hypothetical protein
VASTSVAICDESPLLQSNEPTVTKEKHIVAYVFSAHLIVSRITIGDTENWADVSFSCQNF